MPAELTPAPRRLGPVVALAVLLSLLWPTLQVAVEGTVDSLLWVGERGPAYEAVLQDIPDLDAYSGIGHDGQLYYVISRHPLDPEASGDAVEDKSFRYRRILFPAVAAVLAPGGGRPVIAVFLLESLVGVALGAWALGRLSRWGGPRWLPLTIAVSPGVLVAVTISLADALAAGLGLAAVAMATERRWRAMLAFLVLAALTRETMLIFAVGLALAPGASRAWRAATVAVPTAVLAAWSVWVAGAAGESLFDNGAAGIALPVVEWFDPTVQRSAQLLGLGAFALLVAAAIRSRDQPHVSAILALSAGLVVCYSHEVAFDWVNSMRPLAGMLPLAVWALLRHGPHGVPQEEVPAPELVGQTAAGD